MGEYRYRIGRQVVVRGITGEVIRTLVFNSDRQAETYLLATYGFIKLKAKIDKSKKG